MWTSLTHMFPEAKTKKKSLRTQTRIWRLKGMQKKWKEEKMM